MVPAGPRAGDGGEGAPTVSIPFNAERAHRPLLHGCFAIRFAELAALAGTRRFQGVTGTTDDPLGSGSPDKSVAILEVGSGRVGLVRPLSPARVPPPR